MSKTSWKLLDKHREIASVLSVTVIRPINKKEKLGLSCPVCDTMVRGVEDSKEISRLGACRQCTDKWTYANYDDWMSGWRPSTDQVAAELKERKSMPIFQIALKQNT